MNRDHRLGYYEIMRQLIVGIALVGFALPASAQVAVVDEGTFTISHNGTRLGREEFAIRRTPNLAHLPVIMLSARADSIEAEER